MCFAFTSSLSASFVIHRKYLVSLNLISRYMTSLSNCHVHIAGGTNISLYKCVTVLCVVISNQSTSKNHAI